MSQKAIIVDIDGTLSDPSHRRHLVEGEDKDWEEFFRLVDEDDVNEWCREIVDMIDRLWPTYRYCIYFVTGRPEVSKDGIDVREKTLEWFLDKGIFPEVVLEEESFEKAHLIMRDEGDFRKDTVVKEEILEEELPDPEDILFAIDDRKDVAEMWRRNGITCLQCKDEVEPYGD